MFIFEGITVAGSVAGFFHHLQLAGAGGPYASARVREAMANLLGVRLAIARHGLGIGELAAFRERAGDMLARMQDEVLGFVEDLLDEAAELQDGSEADWYDLCVRRSVLEVLRDENLVGGVTTVDEGGIDSLDGELRRVGAAVKALPGHAIPEGLPANHWWWTYPPPSPIAVSPEQLLERDDVGAPIMLEDLIADGLDGAYRDRIPGIVGLLRSAEPRVALEACRVLVAWGVAEGFEVALAWATDPARAPWRDGPVSRERLHGADAGFERLADAVRSSLLLEPEPGLHARQLELTRALLALAPRVYFDVTLGMIAGHESLREECADDVRAAIDGVLEEATSGREGDPGLLAADLVGALAPVRDEDAAARARVIARDHASHRVLYQLSHSLGQGQGPATLAVLEQLAAAGAPEAAAVLARRRGVPGRLWMAIRGLLWKWDPIGVARLGGPEDEYDSYVGPVQRLLTDGASEEQVFDYLREVETGAMGLTGSPERTRAAARELVRLREDRGLFEPAGAGEQDPRS